MTTKTRNIITVVALLLVTFALVAFTLILSTSLHAMNEGKASPSSSLPAPLRSLDAPGGWKLSGKGQAGPRPGAEAFQVRVDMTEWEQRFGDGAILEVTDRRSIRMRSAN